MPRLAWFAPLAPTRSGIAAYNAELLPLLAPLFDIDVFTDPAPFPPRRASAVGADVFSAHDFLWKHQRQPYDLSVYQLGNASCHDFIWPHLARFPGLLVLHDAQLHHARGRVLLTSGRLDDYRAEFRYNHPGAPEHLPDLFVTALAGSHYYFYPMLRWVLRSARLVAVHSRGLAALLAEEYPGVEVHPIRHGLVDPSTRVAAGRIRERYGIPAEGLLFAAFGMVTPEKRISACLRAFARLARADRSARLLLAGQATSYYDAAAEARELGIAEQVCLTGYVADEELPDHVAAADVCLCLRWPTGGETSGTWIRAIAAGKPTIVTDLAHTAGTVPSIDPLTWRETGRLDSGDGGEAETGRGVSVAVDLLDEERTLALAMERLAADPQLRAALGRAARAWWETHHTMACAVEDYRAVIGRALERPVTRVRDLPKHLLADHTSLLRRLGAEMGVEVDLLD